MKIVLSFLLFLFWCVCNFESIVKAVPDEETTATATQTEDHSSTVKNDADMVIETWFALIKSNWNETRDGMFVPHRAYAIIEKLIDNLETNSTKSSSTVEAGGFVFEIDHDESEDTEAASNDDAMPIVTEKTVTPSVHPSLWQEVKQQIVSDLSIVSRLVPAAVGDQVIHCYKKGMKTVTKVIASMVKSMGLTRFGDIWSDFVRRCDFHEAKWCKDICRQFSEIKKRIFQLL